SIEGATTSQFRNHMLAIAGLPLGAAEPKYPAVAMLNVIGEETPAEQATTIANAFRHSYGKEASPARKLGQLTVVADTTEDRNATIDQLADLIPAGVWPPKH